LYESLPNTGAQQDSEHDQHFSSLENSGEKHHQNKQHLLNVGVVHPEQPYEEDLGDQEIQKEMHK
jgi:hypothetical protein